MFMFDKWRKEISELKCIIVMCNGKEIDRHYFEEMGRAYKPLKGYKILLISSGVLNDKIFIHVEKIQPDNQMMYFWWC